MMDKATLVSVWYWLDDMDLHNSAYGDGGAYCKGYEKALEDVKTRLQDEWEKTA